MRHTAVSNLSSPHSGFCILDVDKPSSTARAHTRPEQGGVWLRPPD
eukprot:SAG11_NODE_25055_length_364_cov_0.943396_1_plen_45_part_10